MQSLAIRHKIIMPFPLLSCLLDRIFHLIDTVFVSYCNFNIHFSQTPTHNHLSSHNTTFLHSPSATQFVLHCPSISMFQKHNLISHCFLSPANTLLIALLINALLKSRKTRELCKPMSSNYYWIASDISSRSILGDHNPKLGSTDPAFIPPHTQCKN